jgi:pimeloyl-ACP methyl ester carboxylesterase
MTMRWQKKRLDVGGWETSVYEGGAGPRLIYLHGMIGNPGWHPFLQALAADWTVIAPCMPGFNDASERHTMRSIHDWTFALSEMADAAGIAGLPIVAASTGAMVALEVEAMRPGTFGPMALVSPLGLWDDAHPVADVFSERTPDQPGFLMNHPANAADFYDNNRAPDISLAELHRYRTRRSAASLVWPIPDHGLASRIHRLASEVHLVWGSDDRVLPAGYRDLFARRVRNVGGTTVIADAGHLAEWDQPAAVARAVAALAAISPAQYKAAG